MSDVVSIGRQVNNLTVSPQFANYSKVIINVDDDTAIEVGDDTGRTLELDNPFGTQQMAQDILNSLTGFQYQPYNASDARLDPAAEIGDAANIRGNYGGIYTRNRKFGRFMKADIAATQDEEIDHEYKFETPQERQFKRQINDVKASLIIANGRIDASVSQTGGSQSSFGWSLTSDSHRWFANGQEVMAITASGLSVKGNVQATTGSIGGFNISASAIWNNISSFGGTQSSGVYIGTNGIQLGQAFKVDSTGSVTATRLAVDTLYIGGAAVSASDLNNRASRGSSAYGWTSSNGSYALGGAGHGYSYNNATKISGGSYPSFFRASTLRGGNLQADSNIILGNNKFACSRVTIGGSTYSLVTWSAY